MALRLLLVAIVLCQCDTAEPPDFVSQNKVGYYWKSDKFTNTTQINDNENWYIQKLLDRGFVEKKIRASMARAKIILYENKPIPCPWTNGKLCNGFQDFTDLHVRNMGCPYNSPINHEMTHWVLSDINGDADANHKGDIWKTADTMPRACSYVP